MNKPACQDFKNRLAQLTHAQGGYDPQELEQILSLCESIRTTSLSLADCRATYLGAIQLVAGAPMEGDLNRQRTILKLEQTAARMLRGDDLREVPVADRDAHRAEVLKTLALFSKRLRDQSAALASNEPVYINVAPPTNTGQPTIAGMNPDAIKDPVKRAEYLAAITNNSNRALSVRTKGLLDSAIADEAEQMEDYVLLHYPATPEAEKEVRGSLTLAGFQPDRIQTLINRISDKDKSRK